MMNLSHRKCVSCCFARRCDPIVVEQGKEAGARMDLATRPQSRIIMPISVPPFTLALAGVRRCESQIKAIDKDDLVEQGNEVGAHVDLEPRHDRLLLLSTLLPTVGSNEVLRPAFVPERC